MRTIELDRGCAGQPLLTERLALRHLRRTDVAAIVRYAGDREVAEMTARIPHPLTAADVEGFVDRASAGHGSETVRAVTTHGDDGLIGIISLRLREASNEAVLGYWLAKHAWRQGYMSEAAQRMVRHGFEDLGLKVIHSSARPDNPASLRVLAKVGFEPAGSGFEDAPARNQPFPVEKRVLNRSDWLAHHNLPVVLVAAVVLLDSDSRVLLARRPPGKAMAGLWEFPGGKVAAGETPEAALIRELREELAIDTAASCLAPLSFASHRYADFHLLMPLFVCRVWSGTPTPLEGQELAWVRRERLRDYEMPPADVGLIAMLRDLL